MSSPLVLELQGGLLKKRFGLASFRPYQEAVCQDVTRGRDVLLVMPTGAGKSLCFQLPGLARGGTTLVVSPLIALMEDQVAKLRGQGIRAERIHSGRDRLASRQVCVQYLQGELDFLFIAPERFSVPGFPEMLARRKPSLIAVDEAHCISHWGHDFRPDYRMLGRRLPLLRPAPVIALTATATPLVQDDIVQQLDMPKAIRHIHGFRRTNIAVETAEVKQAERQEAVTRILADAGRRPAIVYAPTRKEAETLGLALQVEFPAAAYHAGMRTEEREHVQTRFLSGELDVIVATIAFGMGVDKPDIRTVIHTALPGSLEGYYQEIGRAGRDGGSSRAVLLYSYADRRTHEFFHRRSYPDSEVLERIYRVLSQQSRPRDGLCEALGMDPEVFAIALEKLWVHGGARLEPADIVSRGTEEWQQPYRLQCEHKLEQLEQMMRCAQGHECRMLQLVRHFGDQEDSGQPCGLCDVCAPQDCVVRRFRQPTALEQRFVQQVLDTLRAGDGQSTGQLYRKACVGLDRRAFEVILGGLVSAGLLRVSEDAFTKGGRLIRFQRAFLTAAGQHADVRIGARIALTATPAARTRAAGRLKIKHRS